MPKKKIGTVEYDLQELKKGFYVRAGLDPERVLMFGMLIEEGEDVGNLEVDEDGNIIDGRHRFGGYELNPDKKVKCDVYRYSSEIEKISEAYKANYGGALPPSDKDTEHTIRELLKKGAAQKKIAELIGLPPSVAKKFIEKVKAKEQRQKLMGARDDVLDNNLTPYKAAKAHGVDLPKLKEFMGGGGKSVKKKLTEASAIIKEITAHNRSNGQKIRQKMERAMEGFDDGDISEKDMDKIIKSIEKGLNSHISVMQDWRARLIAKTSK